MAEKSREPSSSSITKKKLVGKRLILEFLGVCLSQIMPFRLSFLLNSSDLSSYRTENANVMGINCQK